MAEGPKLVLEEEEDGLRFAPGALEQMKKLYAEHPEAEEDFKIMIAGLRQAHHAWKTGRYKTFDEAVKAVTGLTPQPVDDDEVAEILGSERPCS